jgi:hypothetical protein
LIVTGLILLGVARVWLRPDIPGLGAEAPTRAITALDSKPGAEHSNKTPATEHY